ncbi:MAG: hypothetical protein ACJ8KU_06785 [Chthoniobacterales bacterium]
MKKSSLALVTALAIAVFGLPSAIYAFGEPVAGKCVTEEEAAKIMKKPTGDYPTASMGSQGSSIVPSPYNSGRMIDCSKCPRGSLVVDPMAPKGSGVFKKP